MTSGWAGRFHHLMCGLVAFAHQSAHQRAQEPTQAAAAPVERSVVQAFVRKVRVGSGAWQAGTTEAGRFSATKRDISQHFSDGSAPARRSSGPSTPRINGPNGPTGPTGPPLPAWVCGSQ